MNPQISRHEHATDLFGYRVRQVLNAGTDDVSERTAQRLSAARARAVGRMKAERSPVRVPVLAMALPRGGSFFDRRFPGFAFALATVALVVGLVGMNEWQEQVQIDELAEIDTAILADEVPFTAHLDPNYKTLLVRAE